MKIVERNIVGALLVTRDNKLFQGKKDPDKGGVYIDCWHIPGGGIEDGETEIEAVIREVNEETGIDIKTCEVKLVDNVGKGESEKTDTDTGETYVCQMHFTIYQVNLPQNSADVAVSLDDDLVEYQWTSLEELSNVRMTPPSVELFQRLGYIS